MTPDADGHQTDPSEGAEGRFLESLVGFARSLRSAGLPVTPERTADVARALTWVDIADRTQVHDACRALFVSSRTDLAAFEQLFHQFWKATAPPGAELQPRVPPAPRHDPRPQFTVATYMAFKARQAAGSEDVVDRTGAYSAEERFRRKRFSEMDPEELLAVRRLIQDLRWRAALRRTRRRERHPKGPEIDLRRLLRESARQQSIPPTFPRRRRRVKQRPIVLLADVSGSMETYSRIVLLFFHSVMRSLSSVEAFVFGTRLSRITNELEIRNVDRALDEAARQVVDWAGGTRIGDCLGEFNRTWSRRVLRRGATVVVVSDGCDRGDPDRLARELRHLYYRSYRLIWLNPYVGDHGFVPEARGMKAALEYIDDFLSIRDLDSLDAFAEALESVPARGRSPRVGA
jgi:uncharacterized protein with von Willebrand factor type A (vWA) domain